MAAIMYPFLVFMVIKIAPYTGSSLSEFIENTDKLMLEDPFHITWQSGTLKKILFASVIYVMGFYLYISSMKNTRPDEEYGSARLESPWKLRRKYSEKPKIKEILARSRCYFAKEPYKGVPAWQKNILYSRRIRVAMGTNQMNINTMILGGSGTGKTRCFIIPNIMQLNSSFICTDPKGEILAKTGKLLKMAGYDIRVLDLKNHERSHGYNPFVYFRNDDDVLLFVNNLWASMEDKTANKNDPMWDDLAKIMMMSFCLYIYHYAPLEEQNFDTIMQMYQQIDTSEQKKGPTILDKLFEKIPKSDPAYGYYKGWSTAAGRTLASICSTFSSKMTVFNLDSMKALTFKDEMQLLDLATEKVAIFLLLPDDNAVYNFLAGTIYTQTFQQLYDYADNVVHGPLPQHVRFYMDEFANIALPNDYQKILSTARSRNMSFCIVLQDKQQIEAIFEKYYRTLYGNCSIYLFLGSGEYETCKYYSDLLGDETVVVYNWTRQYGRNGGMSRAENRVSRKIKTPDEIMRLSKEGKCIVYISGEHGSIDNKYDMTRHRNYKYISDGERTVENMYKWGGSDLAIGSVRLLGNRYGGVIDSPPKINEKWRLLSQDQIDRIMNM